MREIELISIPVADQQKAKEFYMKLGFRILVEAPMGDKHTWIQLGLPEARTSITLVDWFPKMPPGAIQGLILGTDDIEAEIEQLKGKGIEIGEIDQTPWGKFAPFTDPDGNGWNLHQDS